MNTYAIYKKTPATRWHKIHNGFSQDQVRDFLNDMSKCETGIYGPSSLMASYVNENGDLIEYKAESEQ